MRKSWAFGALVVLNCGQATAADWSFDPRVAVSGVYNDNVRLSDIPADQISVSGADVDAQLRMRGTTPRSFFEVTPRLRSTFYPSERDQEADDQFVRLSTGFSTQRTRTTLDANWSHVTMLGSYFPTASIGGGDVLGQPNPGDGVTQAGARNNARDLIEFTPKFDLELSERHSLEFQLGYLDAAYDIQVPGDTVDFKSKYVRAAYVRRLSTTSRLSLRGAYSTYDPDADATTAAYGMDALWSNQISQTSEWYVRAGLNRAESTPTSTGGSAGWDSGFGGGAGVRWAFEVSQVFVDLEHGLQPSSAGEYVTRDQLRAEWTRRITPMANVSLGARVIAETGASNQSGFQDRTYAAGTLGFDWRWARQWTLIGSYDYSLQKYSNATNNADSNAFRLGIVWEPNLR